MPLSWLQVYELLSKADAAFLAQPAAAGAHPDELFPLFGLTQLAAPAYLGFLSDGELRLLPAPAGSHYLSTVRTCRLCHCIELDCAGCIERTGQACHWVEPDLCSACAPNAADPAAAPPTRKTCLSQALAPIS